MNLLDNYEPTPSYMKCLAFEETLNENVPEKTSDCVESDPEIQIIKGKTLLSLISLETKP